MEMYVCVLKYCQLRQANIAIFTTPADTPTAALAQSHSTSTLTKTPTGLSRVAKQTEITN